jgi:dipeptidyl aminopeptidase/acylaminoacyl peptidase
MTPRFGYVLVVLLAASTLPGGGAGAVTAGANTERPLAVIVASGPGATSAVLADGSWSVELAFLLPGDKDPAVAPGGNRIAFVSERDGSEEVYLADARTGEVRRLTRNRRPDRRPAWAPGGRRIVWQSGPSGQADLVVARADGSGRQLLVRGRGDDAEPDWSPDGSRIAFSSNRGGRRQLWVVPAAGGVPAQLAETPGRASAPAWSPGGARLAFARESAGNADLWLLDLADTSTRKLTRSAAWDSTPDWSPRGGRIAFTRAAAGRTSLWTVGADGSPARPVEGTAGLADPSWALTDWVLVPGPDERLPDLDQRAPAELVVVQAGRRFRLGFASSTENRGLGALVIRGVRRGGGPMVARQVVERRGGAARIVRDVGRLHYELHSPHYHWHFQSFVRYELRRAGDFRLVVRDRKSGFCLIDRWGRGSRPIPGTGAPRFVGDCGAGQPDARRILEGTSVGYVDRYPAFFHGQSLDLTRVPAGRYVLVHRANPERALRELRYSNDAASVLLRVSRPNGSRSAPRVTVLRRCESSERCPPR